MDERARKFERKFAVEGAEKWFEEIQYYLSRQQRELAQCEALFKKAVEQVSKPKAERESFYQKPQDVMGSAVNVLMNMTQNFGVQQALDIAVRIGIAYEPVGKDE